MATNTSRDKAFRDGVLAAAAVARKWGNRNSNMGRWEVAAEYIVTEIKKIKHRYKP